MIEHKYECTFFGLSCKLYSMSHFIQNEDFGVKGGNSSRFGRRIQNYGVSYPRKPRLGCTNLINISCRLRGDERTIEVHSNAKHLSHLVQLDSYTESGRNT